MVKDKSVKKREEVEFVNKEKHSEEYAKGFKDGYNQRKLEGIKRSSEPSEPKKPLTDEEMRKTA